MEAALDAFQGRVARRLTGRTPRRGSDGKWFFPPPMETRTLSCRLCRLCCHHQGEAEPLPSLPLRGDLPVSRLATLPWKASRAASIFLFRTQDSAPKRRTYCATAM